MNPFSPQIPMTNRELVMNALNHGFHSPETGSRNHEQQLPQADENLVSDPVLVQAIAVEAFYAEQLRSGYAVFQSCSIDTAADEQNSRAYTDYQLQMNNSIRNQNIEGAAVDAYTLHQTIYDPFDTGAPNGGY